MNVPRQKSRLTHTLLLTAFLVAAQWGALVHALDHDTGTASRVCTTCVAASQLGFACVDTTVAMESMPFYVRHESDYASNTASVHTLVTRQRGPPTPL